MSAPFNLAVNKAIRILLFFIFSVNLADAVFAPLFAVYIEKFIAGGTFATVGFATALFAISKSAAQLPIARKLDTSTNEKADFYAMMIGAVVGVMYPVALMNITKAWQLYAWQIILGIGVAALMAAFYTIFSHHVDSGRQGLEWSMFSVGGLTVSMAIGGAVGGVIADRFGFGVLLSASAILNFIGALILIWLYPYIDTIRVKVPTRGRAAR